MNKIRTGSKYSLTTSYILPYLVFGLFFIGLFLQFRLVGVQFDDYGYFTLNYSLPPELLHKGPKYTFTELLVFLKNHYFHASGRLLPVFLDLLVFKVGGLPAVQFMSAVIVSLVMFLLYHIGMSHVPKMSPYRTIGAVLLCLSYGLISQILHQHGTYWYAALFGYYPMIIPTEAFIILYRRYYDRLNWKRVIILCILMFISSWFAETWSIGLVALTGLLLIRESYCKKRLDLAHLLFFAFSCLGFLILVLAPGIQKRLGDREITSTNIRVYADRIYTVLLAFFSNWNKLYVVFLASAVCILGLIIYRSYKNIFIFLNVAACTALTLIMITDYRLINDYILKKIPASAMLLCFFLICAVYLGVVNTYLFLKKDNMEWMLLYIAFMSVVSLVGVPELQIRVIIPFEICGLLLICNAGYELYNFLTVDSRWSSPVVRWAGILTTVSFAGTLFYFSVTNTRDIYQGYYRNSLVYHYNEEKYLEAKRKIDNGEKIGKIILKRNKDDKYASVMLYQQDWFKGYIDQYYELPSDVEYCFVKNK